MGLRIRHVIMLAAAVGVLAALMYYMAGKPGSRVRAEMAKTDALAESIDTGAIEFQAEVQEHKTRTEGTVRVIRETVRRDIRRLDPDGLASAALGEIELWRGSAGNSADSLPSGLDGNQRGIFSERGSAVQPHGGGQDIPP